MINNKDSFLLYAEHGELVNQLSNEQAGELFKSLFKYIATGEIPKMDPLSKMAFISMRQDLDRNAVKYEEKREKLRLNGLKGGRPKKETSETENQMVFSKTKKSLYDNVNVNENENENVLSLCKTQKEKDETDNPSSEDKAILENYVRRKKIKVDNIDAYIRKIIQNGDHISILEKERERFKPKKTREEIIQEEITSIHDKRSAAKVLYAYHAKGSSPPAEFDKIMEKYDLCTYDKLYAYSEELLKRKHAPP